MATNQLLAILFKLFSPLAIDLESLRQLYELTGVTPLETSHTEHHLYISRALEWHKDTTTSK